MPWPEAGAVFTELTELLTQLLSPQLILPRVYHDTTSFKQPMPQVSLQWVTRRADARGKDTAQIGLTPVWRSALASFASQPAEILLCMLVGFAVPEVLAVAFDTPSLEMFIRNQETFCAYKALDGWQPWLWGGLGLLAQVFTQGLIVSMVMRAVPHLASDSSFMTSLRKAWHTLVIRSPSLLFGWLSYVLLMTIAFAGLSVPMLGLHFTPMQLRASIGLQHPLDHPVDLLVSLQGSDIETQGVNILLPDPGTLSCGVAESLEVTVLKPRTDPAGPVWLPASIYHSPVYLKETAWFWPVTFCSLALMLLAETLLRFRSVTAVACEGHLLQTRCNAFAGLAGVGVAWRHFGTVMLHGGVLRLVIACVRVLFVAVPTLLAERLVIPRIGQAVGYMWVIPSSVLAVAAGVAVVNSVLSAFTVVYDARLFIALRQAERDD